MIVLSFEILYLMYDRESISAYQKDLFERMVRFVVSGHLYHPRTGFIKRSRGIASGSVFTNLVDSLCNVLILNYCIAKLKNNKNIFFKVGGDDNVIFSLSHIDHLTISNCVEIFLGMKLNFDVSHIFKKGIPQCHFLGSL